MNLIAPFVTGLSSGAYCLAYCAPFVAPFMVSESRGRGESFGILMKFITGRLVGYAAFGAVAGYLGERFDNKIINLAVTISLIVLSIAMILNALGFFKPERFAFCARIKGFNPQFPLLAGLLMGVNVCPPFLISLTYVFGLHNILQGVAYFMMFFLGTSIYLLPVFFLGLLGRLKEFRLAGRVSALIVGVIFLIYGIYSIAGGNRVFHAGVF